MGLIIAHPGHCLASFPATIGEQLIDCPEAVA
jgi:hypothetical protein